MGNTLQTSITLDHEETEGSNGEQEAIVAGTPLRGKVIVQVKKKVESCNSVTLEVLGREKTNAYKALLGDDEERQQQRYSSSNGQDDEVLDRHAFFRVDLKLQHSGEKVNAKTYEFPFEVILPSSLPSSCEYKDIERGGFSIEYNLLIKTRSKGKFANKRSFRVQSANFADRPEAAVPCLIQPKPIDVDKKLGIVGKGNLFLGACVEDSRVGRGQPLQLGLVCRNHSTCDIDRVVVTLVEEYHWTAKTAGGGGGEKTLLTMERVKLPGLDLRARSRKDVDGLNTQSAMDNTNWEIYQQLISDENKLAIDIPWDAYESFTGVKIKVSHYIKVSLRTMSTVNTPSTRIPIQIGNAEDDSRIPETSSVSSHVSGTEPELGEPQSPVTTKAKFEAPSSPYLSPKTKALDLPQSVRKSLAIATDKNVNLGRFALLFDGQDPSFASESFRWGKLDESSIATNSIAEAEAELNVQSEPVEEAPPSLTTLFEEMVVSVNDYDLMKSKVSDPEWAKLLADLTPEEFGSVIAHVNVEFATPRVGLMLARHMGDGFTCAHCVAAVQNTTEAFRPNMVEGLLPCCVDLASQHEVIKEQLSDFEQIIVSMWNVRDEEKDQVLKRKTKKRSVTDKNSPSPTEKAKEKSTQGSKSKKKNMAPLVSAKSDDICMGIDDHEGTMYFMDVVKWSLIQFANTEYSPPVYKKIKRKLRGRRFLLHPRRKSSANRPHWREATQKERIEFVGKCFDEEKSKLKQLKKATKQRRSKVDEEEWKSTIEQDKKEWRKELHDENDAWDKAITLHSYGGDDIDVEDRDGAGQSKKVDVEEDYDESQPTKYDVCFDVRGHPGNKGFEKEVLNLLKKYPDTTWSPPIYKSLKKRLKGRRFFYGTMKGHWRELTQQERIDLFGTRYEAEKKKMKERQKREAGREAASHRMAGTPTSSATCSATSSPSASLKVTASPSASLKATQTTGETPVERSQDGEGVRTPQQADKKRAGADFIANARPGTPPLSDEGAGLVVETPPPPKDKRISIHSPRLKAKRSMKHPQEFDVCFGDDRHPGSISFRKIIQESVSEFDSEWSTSIYKGIKKKLLGRRYFIRIDPTLPWREATSDERVDLFKESFEAERSESQQKTS